MNNQAPSLDEIIGSYSSSRYRSTLPDFTLDIAPRHVTNNPPLVTDEGGDRNDAQVVTSCGIHNAGVEHSRLGTGFPPQLEKVTVIGVSSAKEGVNIYPEIHFQAYHRVTGAWIIGKGVTRESFALRVVTCNDLGQTDALAKDIKNVGGSAPIHFTDVRYCRKRAGSDLPKDTVKAAVRRISDAARRKASTSEEAVAAVGSLTDSILGDFYPDTAECEQMRPEIIRQAKERAMRVKPGQRDKTGEAPSRTPRRGPKAEERDRDAKGIGGVVNASHNESVSVKSHTRNRPGAGESEPKRHGRPKGSKNRPKSTNRRAWL